MTHAADSWYVGYEAKTYAYGTEPNAYFRRQLDTLPPGRLLLDAFNPRQLGLSSGGPREAELLYEPAQLAADFTGLTLLENHEARVTLR